MGQREFTIGFILITLIAVVLLSYSKLQNLPPASPSPSPSASAGLDILGSSNQQPPPKVQPPPKPVKKTYSKFPFTDEELKKDVPPLIKNKKAVITTNKGVIEFEIYPESVKAASNFIFLAMDQFYDGLTFHRVEPGFVIQGGDPLGNGSGGPGYTFAEEPVRRPYKKGTVAMAKEPKPNTSGSQFFIVLEDDPPLEPEYTIFGQVTKGLDIIGQIEIGDVMTKVEIEDFK